MERSQATTLVCRELLVFVLLLTVSHHSLGSSSILRPSTSARCWCNFTMMDSELKELGRPGRNHAEMVFSFVHTIISLNFKLTTYLADFHDCVRFWLDKEGPCDVACSCNIGVTCCRDSSLATLESSASTLVSLVKHTYTEYAYIPFLKDYQHAIFNIINTFPNAFRDFMTSLKQEKSKADSEKKPFMTFYIQMAQQSPLEAIFAQTMPKNNSNLSILTQIANHYQCDTTKVLPFYLNIYGVVLEFLFMKELHKELSYTSKSHYPKNYISKEDQMELKSYLRMADNMTKHIIFCSTKEIYAIRTQEIKEKDTAMLNAGLIFSSFLLILVIIIVLIAAFTYKVNKQRSPDPVMVVRDEPITSSEEFENRDLLYKRYYETEDAV